MPEGDRRTGRFAHHPKHGGLHLELVQDLPREGPDYFPIGADDLADDLRLVEGPAVRERRVGVDELEWCDGVIALTDTGLVRLTREDLGAEGFLLPGVVRDDAPDFARQIDPCLLAETVLPRPVRQAVDAQHP